MTKRYELQGEAIDETTVYDSVKDKYYFIDYFDEFIDVVNEQDKQLQQYRDLFDDVRESDDLEELLGLIGDNNLTWKAVSNIIKEALP